MENLAASYAELGNFAEAVSWQQKALDTNNRLANKEKAQGRLKLYLEKKPFRDMSEFGE